MLVVHPTVIKLGQRNKDLTERIRRTHRNIEDAHGTTLYQRKKKAEARLNATKKRLRDNMVAKARKRHFRTADTLAFDAQFSAAAVPPRNLQRMTPIVYNIPERAKVIQLVCRPVEGLSDEQNFRRRIEAIEARTALCCRREAQRRGRPKVIVKEENKDSGIGSSDDGATDFPIVCRPTQCLFCLGMENLPYHHRVYEYAKPHQMMNEVGKHLKHFAPEDPVPCPHPQCKGARLVLSSVMRFKNHAARVHKICLRA